MRLICPNCDAQYEIDGALVPALGRDVECSACGQVWFQPKEAENPVLSTELPAPALNRPLSDSVLSILREEAARELHNRQSDRLGSGVAAPKAPDGRKNVTLDFAEADALAGAPDGELFGAPADDLANPRAAEVSGEFGQLPILDWPATTVHDTSDSAPATPAPATPAPTAAPAPRYEVPPLVLPDAEKLAATLKTTLTSDPAFGLDDILPGDALADDLVGDPANGLAADVAPDLAPRHPSLHAALLDELSLPGDTAAEPIPRDLLTPSDPVLDLAEGQSYLSALSDAPDDLADQPTKGPQSQDAKPAAPSILPVPESNAPPETAPETVARTAAGSDPAQNATPAPQPTAPPIAPTPAQPTQPSAPRPAEPSPDTSATTQLPSTVVLQPAGGAGYRMGFGLAVMLALFAVVIYFLAPRLAEQGQLGASLMEWRHLVDEARIWLSQQLNLLLGRA